MNAWLINCDDLGMHESINRGICEVLSKRLVRSASIMPTAPAFTQACELLNELNIDRIGVHLALSAEYPKNPLRPVSTDSQSLTQRNGAFYPDIVSAAKNFDLDEARCELYAQVNRVKQAGFKITHLDGHLFFYEREEGGEALFDMIRELAEDFRLPFRNRGESTETLPIRMLWDELEGAEERADFYERLLTSESGQQTELIIHPAANVSEISHFTSVGTRRFADYCFFNGERFSRLVEAGKISVLAWEDYPFAPRSVPVHVCSGRSE